MKRVTIITIILLLAVAAFAQPERRAQDRKKVQDLKSEASVRRTEQAPKSNARQGRTAHNNRYKAAERQISQNNRREAAARSTTHQNKRQATARVTSPGNQREAAARRTQSQNHREIATRRIQGPNKPEVALRRPSSQTQREAAVKRNTGHGQREGTARRPGNQGQREAVTKRTAPHRQPPTNGTRTKGTVQKHSGKSIARRSAERRANYVTPNRQHVRKHNNTRAYHAPSRYRTVHHHYRKPQHVHVTWTNRMYREYVTLYPDFHYWYYPTGYRIVTIPAFNAYYHIGEVRNVYGRIHEVWYSWMTDEYYLYFGGSFPYHDFSVILSGKHARRYDRFPEAFFAGRYIWVTGLVSTFDGKPEIMVMRRHQVHLY